MLMLKDRIQKGSALLDREKPGWDDEVRTYTLNMGSRKDCVLGQVYGDYETGAIALFGVPVWGGGNNVREAVEDHGFHALGETYEELTQAWTEFLRNRRKAVSA